MATDPEVLGSIPGASRFYEKQWVWNGVHSDSWGQLRSYLEEIVAAPVKKTETNEHATPSIRKKKNVGTTSPTSGGRSVGIVRPRTKATDFLFLCYITDRNCWANFRQMRYRQGHTKRWRANMILVDTDLPGTGVAQSLFGVDDGFDLQRGRDFSLLQSVQTGSRAHPASYSMGNGGSFPAGKGAKVWSRSLSSRADIKDAWSYTSTRLHSDAQLNEETTFTFYPST
jgi:hypothetical protein